MGYYTYYTVNVAKDVDAVESGDFLFGKETYKYANALNKIMERYYGHEDCKDLEYKEDIEFCSYFEQLFFDCCKWYQHDQDMLELSKMFPDVWFIVHGDGEEYDDLWYKYYHNGQMQECRGEVYIDYEPFQPGCFDDWECENLD